MKKGLFRRHRSLRLSALVLGGLLCASTTSAATLVTAVATDYADSQMGTLTGSHVNTLVNDPANEGLLKNLGGDASVFNVHQYGVSKLLLKYNTGGETAYRLLNPNALTEASEGAKGKLSSVTNPHAVAATDQFIYAAGYDQGKIGVLREDGGTLKEQTAATVDLKNDIKQYAGYQFTESYTNHDTGVTQTGNPTDAKVHGEALLINGRNLYAAVSVNPTGSWDSYDDGFLMHYKIKDDGSLTFAGSTRIGRNTDQVRLNRFNDHILLTAIGGKQNTGAGNPSHTGIDIVQTGNDGTVSAATTKKVVLPAHIKSTGEDLRDLKVMPNGTAYVMTYNLTTDGKIDAHVYQTTVSNLLSSNPQDWTELAAMQNAEGSSGKIDAEYTTKNLWMQFGNTLQRYRDGDASATETWQAKDFSSNKAHSNFNKFLKVETDYVTGPLASVVLTQPSELGGTTSTAEANPDAVWKNNAAVTESVTSSQDFSEDTVVSIGKDKLGDPTTNAASAIYAMTGEVTMDAGTNTLQLQSENTVGNPTGIYAGNGSSVTLTAKKINVITKGLDGGNSLTNAIHLDDDGDNGHLITLNGDVNISMSGGLGGNGIAIQNRDHFGEPSMGYGAGPYVEINGNLRIAGSDTGKWGIPLNSQNVISRYNNAGILTRTAGSSVTISGDANMSVYGNGVTVNGADYATPLVMIAGGGRIQVPSGTKYSYYALAAYMGEISMNMGLNGNTPGTRDVQLDGDLFAHKDGGGLKVALTTSHSWLHGLVDAGYAELYLRNGSIWLNEARNERYHQDLEDIGAGEVVGTGKDRHYVGKSRLIKFFGGESEAERGVIYQRDANPITINNYSGHAAVIYNHDAAVPSMFKTGGIVIDKAVGTENVLTLFTDANGVTAANQSAVLNALANKLTYKNYADKKLTGRLAIGEGLTMSSIQKDITFATEQGSYQAATPPTSNEQTTTEFTKRLFGTTDQEYVDAHVKQTDGTYRFTKDSTITYQNKTDMNMGAVKPNADVVIDAKDRTLTVKSGSGRDSAKESAAIWNDGKKLDVTAGTLRLLVNDSVSQHPLATASGIRTTGKGATTIKGMTEIDVGGTKVSKAVYAMGGTVTLDGLTAKTNAAAEDAATLYAQNDGHISVNIDHNNAGMGTVTLDGHIVAKDAASRVDAAIYGKLSHLKGFVYGDGTTNLYLQNGGVWENEKRGANVPTGFTGSHVKQLTGGGSEDGAGVIFQKDDRKITIDKYHGYTKVFFAHDVTSPTTIKGGDIVIKKAVGGSRITLVTDHAGLNTSATAGMVEKNLVNATLDALAKKLWYTGYVTNERLLAGKVQIAEGLTASSASKRLEDITFDAATGRGGYTYTPLIPPPPSQTQSDFTTAINGEEVHDTVYANAGVRKSDGHYIFTKDSTITTGKDMIAAGAWMSNISAAISSANKGTLDIDLSGKNLTVKTKTDVSTTGISAIGKNSKVNVKNAGAISIDAESTNYGQTAALFVNGGGAIHIANGGGNLEDKVLKVRANGNYKTNVAVIKSMNGVTGVESNITIDGLVDVLADGNDKVNGKGANEAVSAVASTINIGGGTIKAINGAWAAIRAYGEFVSQNYGTVNFNVTKGADGLANGAGTNRAVIEGDIVTNGGMGTKGRVSVGLSTADSHWIGNYADTRGYGVTPGQLGAVNLFMKNGSYWKGFSNGSMKVEMSGEGTHWTGFNVGDNLQLKLADGAVWHNAITPEQKDQDNKGAISRVKYFSGEGGFIDMTGENRFLASSNSLSGAPVQTGSSAIEEKGLGETGNLEIEEFSGSTKLLYRHDAASPTTVYGGTTTIKKAAAGSAVTLSTDSVGLNTESKKAADVNLVSATLDALAKKLYYTAYTTGEKNLTGKAEIAEGLTTSAASKRLENITFSKSNGQGSYAYTPAVDPKPPTPQPDPKPPTPQPDPKPPTPQPDPKPPAPQPDPKPPTPQPDPKPPTPKPDPKIEYGDYETKLMSGVKSAMTAASMAWRAEANDLMKRMGDLRLSPEDTGVWARVYRGKSTSNKDNANFRMNYSTIQVGYDKKVNDAWRVGVAGSYMSGSSSYAAGNGKNREGNLGVYGTWSGKQGEYVDLIMKVGRLSNEYTVYNDYGHYVKGDFTTWGTSLSAEYGKRISMKDGSFVEPQLELIYSHLNGVNYTGDTDYSGMKMYVHQKPFDSFIGRVGLGVGKETERSTCYARVSLYHEFAGDMHTDYSDGYTPKTTVQRGSDTWVGVQFGGTMKLNDRTNLYGNFEKTFGGDIKTAWRMDAGMRWNF